MSRQTSYDQNPAVAFAGVLADIRPREVDSKIWEDTTDGVFGIFVTRGTGDNQVKLPTAATDEMLGVVVASQNIELERYATNIAIEATDSLNVLRDGNIYVVTEDACVPGDTVHVRYAAGAGGTQLGACRTDVVTDESVAVDWEFEQTGAAGAVVKIRKK